MPALREDSDGTVQHAIYQPHIRFRTDVPRNRYSVIAVNDWRQIHLFHGNRKFRYICKPFRIRSGSPKISLDQVRNRGTNPAQIKSVISSFFPLVVIPFLPMIQRITFSERILPALKSSIFIRRQPYL